MGSPTSLFPDPDSPEREAPVRDGSFASVLPPPPDVPLMVFGDPGEFWRREPKRRYIILFLLTLLTTTLVGALNDAPFLLALQRGALSDALRAVPHGLWYSLPVLGILGAHEFGHYLACVYYRVNASLPYFLPLPLPPSGTLGAVIRIRQPIPGKRALFDIGIAGPIAGFLALLPFLVLGIGMSTIGTIPTAVRDSVEVYGDPLLLKLVARVMLGPIGDNQTIFIHPMGFAAWWGMLATALNLFPIGQLDGGHITYALFGRRSTGITLAAVGVLVALAIFVSRSWIVWTVVTVGMLATIGPHHPRVFDEDVPLDRGRKWLALFALVMFVLCFTPTPIDLGGVFGQ